MDKHLDVAVCPFPNFEKLEKLEKLESLESLANMLPAGVATPLSNNPLFGVQTVPRRIKLSRVGMPFPKPLSQLLT